MNQAPVLGVAARRLLMGGAVLLGVSALGVLVYVSAGWSVSDALYMVVITIFGVGYGEVRPLIGELRWFTIGLIVTGCSSLIYILGAFFQMVTEGQLNRMLGKRRMDKEIRELTGHIILCGYGRMGRVLCQQLKEDRLPVVVVDNSAERCAQATESGHLALCADATQDAVLLTAGVERAVALATVLPKDALNVFITLTARGLNQELNIVARGELATTESKLRQAGANHIVLPTAIGAERMAHVLTRPDVVEFFHEADLGALEQELLTIGIEIQQFEVTASSRMIGRTAGDLESSGQGGFVVVAVRRVGGSLVRNPKRDFAFAEEDKVLVLGHTEDLPGLLRRFELQQAPLYYRGAAVRP